MLYFMHVINGNRFKMRLEPPTGLRSRLCHDGLGGLVRDTVNRHLEKKRLITDCSEVVAHMHEWKKITLRLPF